MAIETGMEKIRELKQRGYQIIATGEMGIGNTTTQQRHNGGIPGSSGRNCYRPGGRLKYGGTVPEGASDSEGAEASSSGSFGSH